MRWVLIGFGAVAIVIVAGILWTEWQMAGIETPKYEVERAEGPIEVRTYPPMMTASVSVTGPRREATSQGFSPLASYIFGENRPAQKIAMTAPVVQGPADDGQSAQGKDEGNKIAMTAPVLAAPDDGGRWTVSFIMPAEYAASDLPAPNNSDITIAQTPPERVAAIRFSGIAREEDLAQQTALLEAYLEREGLTPAGPARYAYYDPPWRLPFRRRNEVIIPLAPA